MKARNEKSVGKDQVMRTETSRDRSDGPAPNSETLMGKTMKDTGVTRSISGGKVPKYED